MFMLFQKILAGLLALAVIWVLYPHIKRGEMLAPNPLPPDSWVSAYVPANQQALASPDAGYGFRRFDFWNNPPTTARPATKDDLSLRR